MIARHLEPDHQVRGIEHARDGGARRDDLADLCLDERHHAVDRRREARVGQLCFSRRTAGVCFAERGLGTVGGRDGTRQASARDPHRLGGGRAGREHARFERDLASTAAAAERSRSASSVGSSSAIGSPA